MLEAAVLPQRPWAPVRAAPSGAPARSAPAPLRAPPAREPERLQPPASDGSPRGAPQLGPAAQAALGAALGLQDSASSAPQDVAAAAILSECIYKSVDRGPASACKASALLEQLVPPGLGVRLHSLQFSPPGQPQRYLLAEAGDALFVALLGSKLPADLLANADWKQVPFLGATAHRRGAAVNVQRPWGYLRRVDGLPLVQLHRLAAARGQRLVFTGHSLGGAVAVLATLRLLSQLPPSQHASVQAIGFAVPPVGGAGLAAAVQAQQWEERLLSYYLPEDWLPLPQLAAAPCPPRQQPRAEQQAWQRELRWLEPAAAAAWAAAADAAPSAAGGAPATTPVPLERRAVLLGILAAAAALAASLLSQAGQRVATRAAYQHVGRVLGLPHEAALPDAAALLRAAAAGSWAASGDDALVPLEVRGPLRHHRMVTYRNRLLALKHSVLQAAPCDRP
eukprot:scaffold12.g8199.t1